MPGFLHFWGFLWPFQLCFLDDLLKLCCFTRWLYFHHSWWEKRRIKWTLQIFLKNVTDEKNVEIHKHSWLSIIWIFRRLNSLNFSNYLQSKTSFGAKLVKNHIHKLELSLPWTNLCFILISALSLFRFELSRVNCSCSFFLFCFH